MKLYVYDHCPYCVRARMIFGMKDIEVEQLAVLNDDEATPVSLVGKKVVPILLKEDGTAMPESLDIVNYIDENYAGSRGKNWLSKAVRVEVEQWLKDISVYNNRLVCPRFVKLGLPEFVSQSAIDYFVNKKQENYGDFTENLRNTAQYLEKLQHELQTLEMLIQGEFAGGTPSLEDIILFPILRNLTCIKGLEFSPKIGKYVANMANLSKIDLYTDRAV